MSDQIDIRPMTGRRLLGMIGGKPRLGDEVPATSNHLVFNGVRVGHSEMNATAPLFITQGDRLSAADVYAIQAALSKHHKTTKIKRAIRPFNRGHQPRRFASEEMRAKIYEDYRRRRRLLSTVANRS